MFGKVVSINPHVFVDATASLQPRMEVSRGLNTEPGSAGYTLPNGDYTSSKGDTEGNRRLISSPEGIPILVFPGSARFKFVKARSPAQTDHFLSLNALQSELKPAKPLVGVQGELEYPIFNLGSETGTSLDMGLSPFSIMNDHSTNADVHYWTYLFLRPPLCTVFPLVALLSTILEFVTFPVLLYILAPFVAFLELFLEIWVLSPYRAIIFVADALYPTYVFLGMACITGALLGLVGRYLVRRAVAPPTPPPSEAQDVKRTHTVPQVAMFDVAANSFPPSTSLPRQATCNLPSTPSTAVDRFPSEPSSTRRARSVEKLVTRLISSGFRYMPFELTPIRWVVLRRFRLCEEGKRRLGMTDYEGFSLCADVINAYFAAQYWDPRAGGFEFRILAPRRSFFAFLITGFGNLFALIDCILPVSVDKIIEPVLNN
ncbi:hypothetical protein K438DRAFT_1997834 [Mycena galopus ATCC 62051]|nr:hypothetical protein K438DRAFT_1997834 [Mycena galopus ATCC 62051]